MDSYNFLTPIDEEHTRYYWFQMRNVLADDPEASRLMAESVRSAFEEDRLILNAVQQGFAATQSPHIDIATAADRSPHHILELIAQVEVGLVLGVVVADDDTGSTTGTTSR